MRCSSILALFFISGGAINPTFAHAMTPSEVTSSSGTRVQANSDAKSEDNSSTGKNATQEERGEQEESPQGQTDQSRNEKNATASPTLQLQSANQWLAELQNIITNANFQVSFVQTIAGKETVPYLWRHGIMEDGSELEQLNLQNGPGRELIRVNDVVSVFEPDVQPYSLRSKHINGPIPSA